MKKAFIVHGTNGHPNENWFSWLREELEKCGYAVFIPGFPTPENMSLESWLAVFEKYQNEIDEDTIFVGHSLGCAFILTILEGFKAKSCYFVSGFTGLLSNPEMDDLNRTISDKDFDWESICSNCSKFVFYHSDNDPYVPLLKAKELCERLSGELVVIPGAGHFNDASGYVKFKELKEKIIQCQN